MIPDDQDSINNWSISLLGLTICSAYDAYKTAKKINEAAKLTFYRSDKITVSLNPQINKNYNLLSLKANF